MRRRMEKARERGSDEEDGQEGVREVIMRRMDKKEGER